MFSGTSHPSQEFTSVTRVDHCVGANLGDHLDVASRILLCYGSMD